MPLLADLAGGLSLARVLDFHGPQLRCFGAAAAASVPLEVGDFNGRVIRGASCNCSVLTLTPHANGTHTECVGHLTVERVDAHGLIPQQAAARLPADGGAGTCGRQPRNSVPAPQAADLLITRAQLERTGRLRQRRG